ncbi:MULTISPECIES: TusE/DsrC/DsvC family sulfur relay protein [unclassified Moraxella]|uniref:TusE/DsrC/DsvC family sulfur relay protein n=1 Tax=unclassified Moraxella TaxID=2685852 RepID=UPI002B4061DF|nr:MULTISPECIES: TusE/DsrC/DsvC family sulfur relay protein [unclassified Moraxella]
MTNTIPELQLDGDGHLTDHTLWTPSTAQQLADTLNIKLDGIHYRILDEVRAFFDKYHHSPATRPLIKHLSQSLPDDEIDNAKLQRLFNTGLVARHINRIAGLPKPPNCL